MAITIHVASHGIMRVSDTTNQKYYSTTSSNISIKDAIRFHTDDLVTEDSTIPSSLGNPNIKAYLAAEAAAGYSFKHMDQTYIITEKDA